MGYLKIEETKKIKELVDEFLKSLSFCDDDDQESMEESFNEFVNFCLNKTEEHAKAQEEIIDLKEKIRRIEEGIKVLL